MSLFCIFRNDILFNVRTVRSRNDQAQFGGYDDGRDGLLVTRESGARCRCLTLANDGLRPGVPMPEKNGAVCTSGGDVAIGCDVALAAR